MGNKLSSLFNMGRVCLLVSFVLSALVWQTYQFPSLVNNEFGVETLNKIDAKLIRESLFSSDRAKRSPRRRGKKLNLRNKDDSSSESESSSEEESPETDDDYSVEDAIDNDIANDYSVEVSQVERLRSGPRQVRLRSKRSESSEEDGSASSSEEEETTEALVRSKRSEDSSKEDGNSSSSEEDTERVTLSNK